MYYKWELVLVKNYEILSKNYLKNQTTSLMQRSLVLKLDNLKLNFSLMHSAKVIFLQVPKLNKNFKWIIDGVCGTIHDELL